MNLAAIYQDFQMDLKHIEYDLINSLQTEQKDLHAASLHPLKAGGKRLRPLFVLLAGQFGNGDKDKLNKLATAMELIHMATLVHDDVIDHSSTRRGQKTVRALWDDQIAVTTGNFIFSRALEQISEFKDPVIHQLFSSILLHMCKGEILQSRDLFNINQSLRHYLHRIKRKTAILFAISCQLGSLVTKADPQITQMLYTYGYYVGMAFQLIDDVLDFEGTEDVIGKPAGSDLRQGNITLPVIYALEYASNKESERIKRYIMTYGESESIEEILSIVHQAGGIQYTKELAKRYLHKANLITTELPECRAQYSLQWITHFLANRTY